MQRARLQCKGPEVGKGLENSGSRQRTWDWSINSKERMGKDELGTSCEALFNAFRGVDFTLHDPSMF